MGDGDPFPRAAASGILPEFDIHLSFRSTLAVNRMPPIPDKLSVKATATMIVTNNSGKKEILSAPTPCDVHHWDLLDEAGRLLESEKDGMCFTLHQTKVFEPGESIRTDYVVSLNGKILDDGNRYKLRMKFWGFEGEAAFVVESSH